MHSPYYKNSQVTFKSVIKKAQFKKEWDKIPKGTSELYLYLHGGVSCLYFDGSDMNLKELLALKRKNKKKIVLLSCKGGIGDKNSVAKIMAKNVNVLCMHLVIHMDYLIDMIKEKSVLS